MRNWKFSRRDALKGVALGAIATPAILSGRASAEGGDSYCLNIRSYVVARDSKNSDSVHLTGYTTCVPASRFRLRTADIHERSDR